jgi:hypothetical protein
MFGTCSGFPAPELLETHAALLRTRHERPRRRSAEERDEIAELCILLPDIFTSAV